LKKILHQESESNWVWDRREKGRITRQQKSEGCGVGKLLKTFERGYDGKTVKRKGS